MRSQDLTGLIRATVFALAATLLLPLEGSAANSSYNRPDKNTVRSRAFTSDTTFGEAIDVLRHSTKPPLNIVVLWRDLSENAEIYRETPIGADGIPEDIPLRKQLELLLMSVSAGAPAELGYVVEDGVIIIATEGYLPRRMTTRIYDITDLVSGRSNYFGFPTMGPTGYNGMPYGGPQQGMRPYGVYGRAYSGRTGSDRAYGVTSPYGFNRGSELADLVQTLYGPTLRDRRSRRGAR